MTVRQVFYQATVHGVVEKTEDGYRKVQNDLTIMRREMGLPYDWLADNTRWQRKPRSFDGVDHALEATARLYRKDLWAHADCYVEIWLEKDALSGVILPVTARYDVPLMVARGYSSLSFLHTAATYIARLDVPTFIYHLGDFDPSGVNAGEKIEETLREMAPAADITFERIAVNPDQIAAWNLPSRPTKQTDSRAKNFGAESVELDAIEPNQLRDIVTGAIEWHLPADALDVLKAAEESERSILHDMIGRLRGARHERRHRQGQPPRHQPRAQHRLRRLSVPQRQVTSMPARLPRCFSRSRCHPGTLAPLARRTHWHRHRGSERGLGGRRRREASRWLRLVARQPPPPAAHTHLPNTQRWPASLLPRRHRYRLHHWPHLPRHRYSRWRRLCHLLVRHRPCLSRPVSTRAMARVAAHRTDTASTSCCSAAASEPRRIGRGSGHRHCPPRRRGTRRRTQCRAVLGRLPPARTRPALTARRGIADPSSGQHRPLQLRGAPRAAA
jgi:hypothetical protein